MSLTYEYVLWNKQKKKYDWTILIFVLAYLCLFTVLSLISNPNTSIETLIIRGFGTLALLMLHFILLIGPLSRINPRFLIFLYNRRHLGVSMFLAAAIHGLFSLIQFHALGNTNPIYSLFTSNLDYDTIIHFPFQVLGFVALIILFFMAATSHDFWLHNLSPKIWKSIHFGVYIAYSLIILHVFLGAFQQEDASLPQYVLAFAFVLVASIHLWAGLKEKRSDKISKSGDSNYVYACLIDEIAPNRAFIVNLETEKVAIFKYDNKLSAVSNVCKHQNGPLGEGKVVRSCITCPWHGYQYNLADGRAPAPFSEKLATYNLKLIDDKIYIDPKANEEGCFVEPLIFDS